MMSDTERGAPTVVKERLMAATFDSPAFQQRAFEVHDVAAWLAFFSQPGAPRRSDA
jgi:hypothetical protein